MNLEKTKAFTLVELIVVITILAILGTIVFISLQGYSAQSRDSARISDISSIKTSLELFQLDAGKYPLPTGLEDITYSGGIVWKQGTFGDTTYNNVEHLDKIPTDPLTDSKYTYSVTQKRNEYELAGIVESDILGNINLGDSIYAGETEATAIVSGNYNGLMNKTVSGATCYVLSLPTIIASDIETSTDIEYIVNNNRLVYNGFKNLPSSYRSTKFNADGGFGFNPNKLLSYNGGCDELSESLGKKIKLIVSLQYSYSGTNLDEDNGGPTGGKIGDLLDLETGTDSFSCLIAGGDSGPLSLTGILDSSGCDISVDGDDLWGDVFDTSEGTSISARRGPCKLGYHIPTKGEWEGLLTAGQWGNNGGTMSSALYIPFYTDQRVYGIGQMNGSNNTQYWLSSVNGTEAYRFYININTISIGSTPRLMGLNLRCFKD